MDSILKFLLFLVFAPALLVIAFQVWLVFLVAILPWLIVLAALVGVVAGLAAGLVLRRRLPSRNGGQNPLPPGGAPVNPVRRPRGVRARTPQDWGV